MALGRIYLALGSNACAEHNISSALRRLHQRFGSLSISNVYRSRPLLGDGEDYLNLVVSFAFQGDIETLKTRLIAIEDEHGRLRGNQAQGATSLDLDILSLQQLGAKAKQLTVPAEVLDRSFVIAPLAQLAPNVIECHSGLSFAQLWLQMDKSIHPLTEVFLESVCDATS